MPAAPGDEGPFATIASFIRRWAPQERARAYARAPGHGTLIEQAARRRGLEVRHAGASKLFFAGERFVFGTCGLWPDTTTRFAIDLCRHKDATKGLLAAAGLPVPDGRAFARDEQDDVAAYARSIGWPVVVKPANMKAGRGISTGIRDEETFEAAWRWALEESDGDEGRRADRILVERHVDGIDIRAFVVGPRVVAATTRLPPSVVGDGEATVEELIRRKNEQRGAHAHLRHMPLVVDEAVVNHLASQGIGLDHRPAEGRVVLLHGRANLSAGGDSVDVTDALHPRLARLAVDATRAIRGLDIAGVDLIAAAPEEPDDAVVLEVNTAANISMHHYPLVGEPRDVAGAIVDRLAARRRSRPLLPKPLWPAPGRARRRAPLRRIGPAAGPPDRDT